MHPCKRNRRALLARGCRNFASEGGAYIYLSGRRVGTFGDPIASRLVEPCTKPMAPTRLPALVAVKVPFGDDTIRRSQQRRTRRHRSREPRVTPPTQHEARFTIAGKPEDQIRGKQSHRGRLPLCARYFLGETRDTQPAIICGLSA